MLYSLPRLTDAAHNGLFFGLYKYPKAIFAGICAVFAFPRLLDATHRAPFLRHWAFNFVDIGVPFDVPWRRTTTPRASSPLSDFIVQNWNEKWPKKRAPLHAKQQFLPLFAVFCGCHRLMPNNSHDAKKNAYFTVIYSVLSRPKHVARNLYIELRAIFAGICGIFFASSLPTRNCKAMLALCSPLLDLSRPYVSRMLPQVGPMWALCWPMSALCWPYIGLTWPYLAPMLALCSPMLAYLSLMFAKVSLMLA